MYRDLIDQSVTALSSVLMGKEKQVRLALCCLISQGHLLLEDLPGMGKTTLAHALAKLTGLDYKRVQFTSDLLPSDIIGVSIFDRETSTFNFKKGAIFCQLLLADEINRTTPRSQSALLEAMEEKQVTVDGTTYELPEPFFVIATQNPIHQSGTYPLPESQLDRFLMCISLGYPDAATERELLKGINPREKLQKLPALLPVEKLNEIQEHLKTIHVSDNVVDYLQRLIAETRQNQSVVYGLSPRGALALLQSAKAWAVMDGREHLLPEDLQIVFPVVARHRLESINSNNNSEKITTDILNIVPVLV